jgi:hypothetical protein
MECGRVKCGEESRSRRGETVDTKETQSCREQDLRIGRVFLDFGHWSQDRRL